MSAMPAEAEPHRPGPGAVPPITRPKAAAPPVADARPAQALPGQHGATQARTANTGSTAPGTAAAKATATRAAGFRAAPPGTAGALASQPGTAGALLPQPRSAGALEIVEALEAKVRGTVRAAQDSWAEAVEGQTPKAEAREAEIVQAGAAETETPEAGTAGAAQWRTPRALHPATVRPRQLGLMPSPARRRPRPAGLRPRRVSTRLHPTGVRACSDVVSAQPLTAAPLVPQARPSYPGDSPQRLRLTRRGRVVLAVFAAVVVGLIGLAAANGTRAAGPAATASTAGHTMTRIVVQPGQTLWTIATQADPQADPRQVVQQIIAANALRGGGIRAGQRLLVPRS
jgi:hypothetical protein